MTLKNLLAGLVAAGVGVSILGPGCGLAHADPVPAPFIPIPSVPAWQQYLANLPWQPPANLTDPSAWLQSLPSTTGSWWQPPANLTDQSAWLNGVPAIPRLPLPLLAPG